MKILVTGAAGFIGSHLCERLHQLGHDVVGIDVITDYYSRSLKEYNLSKVEGRGIKVYRLDLALDNLSEAVNGVEVVFHLAAQPGISQTVPFEKYLSNNLVATFRLLEAVKSLNSLKCFVNIATSSVYGKFAQDSEDSAPKPTSFYGVTKLAAEQLALSYFRDRGLPACSLRIFSVYGERERPDKGFHKLIRCILEDREFPLFEGSEKHERSYTYISDILDGFELVLNNMDKCTGEIFNIGSDVVITTGEGITIVENALGKKAILKPSPKRAGDQEKTKASINKAKRVLGYSPKVLPSEGLVKEAVWFRDEILGKVNLD